VDRRRVSFDMEYLVVTVVHKLLKHNDFLVLQLVLKQSTYLVSEVSM
jgi:hypothetical protein